MITLEALRSAEHLAWIDAHLARVLSRIGGDERSEVVLATALVSRAVRQGHVCLDLQTLSRDPIVRNADGEIVSDRAWPDLALWLERLHSSPLIADGAGNTPLVLDAAGRLYLRRYWDHEVVLAQAIQARAAYVDDGLDAVWLRPTLDRLFDDHTRQAGEVDWQRVAALLAAQRRFCVISGGPGTGKTYTVVKILALLVELAAQRGQPAPRIVLVAPTGKAASRLVEAIRKAKRELHADDNVKAAIPEEAATIHRCLKSIGGSATQFRHNAAQPLVADVVLVDEASMVDVGLMARLVAAVPPQARLILLGDKDQLASVEAGAVLGDICNTGATRPYSQPLVKQVMAFSGESLPLLDAAPRQTGIWDCIVQLTRSYRYSERSGIGTLARAINAGAADAAVEILADTQWADVARLDPGPDWELSGDLQREVVDGFAPYLQETDPAMQLLHFGKFRVLCAHRRGIGGVQTLNRQVEETLRNAGLLLPDETAYPGRPLMITQNDYQVRLFNGDVGLVYGDRAHAGGRRVAFVGDEGRIRHMAPARLPPHDTVFALSIHKSQGSEFEHVAIVLPERVSPILSRELLYTAVTRAQQRVTIHAKPEIIRGAIERRVERASGLRARLWDRT